MPNDAYFSTDLSLPIPDQVTAYMRSVATPHEYNGFETLPLQHVEFVSYSKPLQQLIYRLNVPAALCNKDGNLHGGAATTLLDNLSSTALYTVSSPGFWDNLGVSRSLYILFHRPVPVGSKALVICTIVKAGRRMVTLRAEIFGEVDGSGGDQRRLCATCIHEKVYTASSSKLS